ncbi:MAG: signal peptidase I [Bacilli bacterium]
MKYLPSWLKKLISVLSQLLFIVLILTGGLVIFHNFYFTPIKIVGSSMEPTLVNQEFGVMDQNPQTLKNLERFDIVIVKQNPTVDRYLIKRLIGLPGETIALQEDGTLLVNGLIVDQPFLPEVGYQERTCSNANAIGCIPLTLDDESYFVMGDNRGFSTDSRVFGPIQTDQLIGKLFAIEGICQGHTTTSANDDPDTCGTRQYFWPRIFA